MNKTTTWLVDIINTFYYPHTGSISLVGIKITATNLRSIPVPARHISKANIYYSQASLSSFYKTIISFLKQRL